MLPPQNPRIALPNYLLDLREDIKIVGAEKILLKWHRNNFKTYSEAAKTFKLSESFYRRVITGLNPLPIWILRKICENNRRLLDEIFYTGIKFTARQGRDTLPKHVDPRLAYYVGFLHGDGHLDSNEKRVSFYDQYSGQINLMNELTLSIFDVPGRVFVKKNKFDRTMPALDVGRVTVNSFLSEVLKVNRGKRIANIIPGGIAKNKTLLKWYICGLFDAEGAMPLNPQKRRDVYVDIAMKDSALINEVKKILEKDFGIISYGPYQKIAKHPSLKETIEAELKIRKQSEVIKFLEIIGTIHPDKVRRKTLILNLLKE